MVLSSLLTAAGACIIIRSEVDDSFLRPSNKLTDYSN